MPEFPIQRFFRRNTRLITLITVTLITIYTITLQFPTTQLSRLPSPDVTSSQTSGVSYYCDRKTAKRSDSCLCYYNYERPSRDVKSDVTTEETTEETSDAATEATSDAWSGRSGVKCAMTIIQSGRLGNAIGQYATLFTLSKMNDRPALVCLDLWLALKDHFHLSLPVLSEPLFKGIRWNPVWVYDEFDESYARLEGRFVKLKGYVSSLTFFKGFEEEVKREFRFKREIQERAEKVLRAIGRGRRSVTFVGVHVRRGDYVRLMRELYRGVLADRKYLAEATDHFRKRYRDAVFVVVSDDMRWCEENIGNENGDVYYVGNGNESRPIDDFAILVNCNHSVITIGTFGFFGAWFAGGDTVYFANFTPSDSLWNEVFLADTAFPSHWHPIAAQWHPIASSEFTPFDLNVSDVADVER